MPTYQNTSQSVETVKNKEGGFESLKPGESIETLYYTDNPNLTKTSDEPYFNRIVGEDALALSGEHVLVDVSLYADIICFLEVTGVVTAYAQSTENEPPELRDHMGTPVIQIPAKGRFNRMMVSGSGTCRVVQYKL